LSATSTQPSDSESPPGPNPDARPAEFRPYRRFVSLVALTIIFVGVSYLILSVAVTIYRQRHAIKAATPIAVLTKDEMSGCLHEMADVTVALEKHLEKSHYLLGGYDPAEAQRWADEGDIWRNQWRVLGERCRFGQPVPAPAPPQFDELSAAYKELGDTAAVYTKELLRFVREQAPRLDRLRSRITRIGERLAAP
jgi:hypothetical protein